MVLQCARVRQRQVFGMVLQCTKERVWYILAECSNARVYAARDTDVALPLARGRQGISAKPMNKISASASIRYNPCGDLHPAKKRN